MATSLEIGKLLSSTPSTSYRISVPQKSVRCPVQFPKGCVLACASRTDNDVLPASSSSSSPAVTRAHMNIFKQGVAGAAASLVLAGACAPAGAYNVRLQDVENKAMQAGKCDDPSPAIATCPGHL